MHWFILTTPKSGLNKCPEDILWFIKRWNVF